MNETLLVILWLGLSSVEPSGDGGMRMIHVADPGACETIAAWSMSAETRPGDEWRDVFKAKCFPAAADGEEILLVTKWATPNGDAGLEHVTMKGAALCTSVRDWFLVIVPDRWRQGFFADCFAASSTP
jgi:hypothetical protein